MYRSSWAQLRSAHTAFTVQNYKKEIAQSIQGVWPNMRWLGVTHLLLFVSTERGSWKCLDLAGMQLSITLQYYKGEY